MSDARQPAVDKSKPPPQFCGHCPNASGNGWHCQTAGCLWAVCVKCKQITDIGGLIGRGGEAA